MKELLEEATTRCNNKKTNLMRKNFVIFAITLRKIQSLCLAGTCLATSASKYIHRIGKILVCNIHSIARDVLSVTQKSKK